MSNNTPSVSGIKDSWSHLHDLELADPFFTNSGPIDVILGVDAYGTILRDGLRQGPHGNPTAQNTIFGWVISGPVADGSSPLAPRIVCTALISDGVNLNQLVEQFWEAEQLPSTAQLSLTPEEQQGESRFIDTHSRDSGGRYIVRLPLRSSIDTLGSSYPFAEQSLKRIHRRSLRDATFGTIYREFLEEYKELGHMTAVPNTEKDIQPAYFLPHHGVLRETSSTTRLRVVFNGSEKTYLGTSLNDILLPGPKLQNDLVEVLLRWRLYPIVFSADIQKMYQQILIDDADRDFQRILWSSNNESPQIFRLNTVTYGLTSVPWLALRVLRQLVQDECSQYPLAVEPVLSDMYVDDVLSGAYSLDVAKQTVQQLNDPCMAGGFRLHKWAAAIPEILDSIEEEHLDKLNSRSIEDSPILRTLGLSWRIKENSFGFCVRLDEAPTSGTSGEYSPPLPDYTIRLVGSLRWSSLQKSYYNEYRQLL